MSKAVKIHVLIVILIVGVVVLKVLSDNRPIAYPINFHGPGVYSKAFAGKGYGVVFEDDGDTGYFYATNEALDNILDALHLYDASDPERLKPGEEAFIVVNSTTQRSGIYYHGKFQAVFDFKKREARCRTAFPPLSDSHEWSKSPRDWDDEITESLRQEK